MFEITVTGKVSKVNQTETITWVTLTRAYTHNDARKFQEVTLAYKDDLGKKLLPGAVIEVNVNLSVHEEKITCWPMGRTRVFNPEVLMAD